MNDISLTGLDAQNPLAFFAALGTLRVLDDDARRRRHQRPLLRFEDRGAQVPIVQCKLDYAGITSVILEDAGRWGGDGVLQLAYDDSGKRVPPDDKAATRDLKPSPELAREVLENASVADRASADFAAACFSELVQDNNGRTKPTALHFTAGQQTFLAMVDELRTSLSREHLDEALLGPWRGRSTLPSLTWDATVARAYALRAGNPAKEKRGSVPGANWLAVRALGFFPVVVRRRRLETTCLEGGWKDAVFRWPVWSTPATVRSIGSLLKVDVCSLSARERDALGVSQVFAARILRADQGGYGSFSPAEIVGPSRANWRS